MSMATVYSKGQVTIPKAMREAVGIEVGDRLVIEVRGDEVVLRRPKGVLEFESPSKGQPPVDLSRARMVEIITEEVGAAYAAKFGESR